MTLTSHSYEPYVALLPEARLARNGKDVENTLAYFVSLTGERKFDFDVALLTIN
jgi:hypothetical protein